MTTFDPSSLTEDQIAEAQYELHRRYVREDLIYWAETAIRFDGEDYTPSRCHRVLLDKLARVSLPDSDPRHIKKLMVKMPSGSGKTTYLSRIFPPWWMANHPGGAVIGASHNASFAEDKVSARVMDLMVQYADVLGTKPVNEKKSDWEADNRSTYRAAGVGAGILGERGDLGIIDDPFGSFEDANSETIREKVYQWYRNTFITRLKPGARQILMHQRVHMDDLAGRLLEEEGDEWEVLFLPAVYEGLDVFGNTATFEDGTPNPDFKPDPLGREIGGSVWPEYFNDDFLRQRKKETSAVGWASMYQQRPTPAGGSLFTAKPARLGVAEGLQIAAICRAWDIASTAPKGSNDPDWTVGLLMARLRNGSYIILDIKRFRAGPETVRQTIIDTAAEDDGEYGRVTVSLPQNPGSAGKYVIADLTRGLAGHVIHSSPESGDKYTRAMPVAAMVNSGNVSIIKGPYLKAFEDELELFPNSKKDDQIDALSRAFGNVAIRPKLVRRRWANSSHMAR